MRKLKIIIVVIICLFLYSCNNKLEDDANISSTEKNVLAAITETNSYLAEKMFEEKTFAGVLQSKLENSLVYELENKYLIIYDDLKYIYENKKINKTKEEYLIVDNVNEALNIDIGSIVLTKGYYSSYDGGNACYRVEEYHKTNDYIIANEDNTKCLKYITYNSIINIKQMGYKENEVLDEYVNKFTKELTIGSIFIPKGIYKVISNFNVDVADKAYYSYEASIYSDDDYNKAGGINGCLFYVFNNVKNIIINGFDLKIYVNKKLNSPLLGLVSARDVDGLKIYNCSFYLPKEASMYPSSGIIDFFTGWQNVEIKNCHLENHSSTVGGGGLGFRDILKRNCRNALIENNYIYSNCKDEVIAVFSGGDTSLYPDETGGGSIDNVVFKNNTIEGGKPNDDIGPRVVGLTVGYQLSPVTNVVFIDNDIKMYSANYLLLYGKTDRLSFKNNRVEIDSSYQEKLYTLFWHNSYADEAFNIVVDNNTFETINNSTIKTVSETDKEFSFTNNTCKFNLAVRLFDSPSVYENNTFTVDVISGCIYHNIKETKNNKITIKKLNVVYELYNLNFKNDIMIIGDEIKASATGANFMMFNGDSIHFNNHNITFKDFKCEIERVESQYYYLAYDTTAVKDKVVINFINSDLSIYNDKNHNFIARDEEGKVTIVYK